MALLQAIAYIVAGAFSMLGSVTSEIGMILLGIWLLSKEAQGFTKDVAIKFGEVVKTCLQYIGQFLNWLIDFIKQIIEVYKHIGGTTLEFAAYFNAEYSELRLQVEKLDAQRAK